MEGRKQQIRDELVAEIERVFDGVSREDGITLHQAEAMDKYYQPAERVAFARRKDRESRWQDVPDRDIEMYYTVLSYADVNAFRYYLPAYMRWTLRFGEESDSSSGDSTIYTLTPPKEPDLQEHFLAHIAAFTDQECRTICRFLRWIVEFDEGKLASGAAREALEGYWSIFCEPYFAPVPGRDAEAYIDFAGVRSEREVHERFARRLFFPQGYGHNWDAFWDVLTGFDCFPRRLVLHGTAHLRAAVPRAYEQLQTCFRDCRREHPEIAPEVVWL